jgi:hypothetical protein
MAGVCLLHGIGRKKANRIDTEVFKRLRLSGWQVISPSLRAWRNGQARAAIALTG